MGKGPSLCGPVGMEVIRKTVVIVMATPTVCIHCL